MDAIVAEKPAAVEPAAGPDPVVVRGLNHWFGKGEARKQALFDVDLRVKRGQLVVLMGASGSGKTTLLTLMGCLREVQDGGVRLLGHELNGARKMSSSPADDGSASSFKHTICTRA